MPKLKKASNSVMVESEKWRVESDLNTILEAEKIQADPKRFKPVQALAKEKMMAVAKLASDKDED